MRANSEVGPETKVRWRSCPARWASSKPSRIPRPAAVSGSRRRPRTTWRICAGAFGPRLRAVLSVLAGAYRLGKRPIRQLASDLFGLVVSIAVFCYLVYALFRGERF